MQREAGRSGANGQRGRLADGLVLAGRYRLGRLLGEGGMAEVYDGTDLRLGRPVAVKVLKPHMAVQPEVRSRFEAEARSAARLSHPNVVGVFDTGEDGDTPFIVMERLPGETLADRLRAGPLDPEWTRAMAGDVLGALGAAHAAGIVHRDVKPGNILISDDECAKVADFGIAKSIEGTVDGAPTPIDVTVTGALIGTPAYFAPERIEGEPASTRSDIYSFGVVLYESLAGTKPYSGSTPVGVATAIQRGEHAPLGELRPDLEPALVSAVERAMAPEPEDRFTTAAEFAHALKVGMAAPASAADATVIVGDRADATQTMVLEGAGTAAAATAGPGAPPLVGAATLRPLRSKRVLLALGLAAVFLLALIGLAAATGDGNRSPAPERSAGERLAADMRRVARSLGPDDGTKAPEVGRRLRDVAGFAEKGEAAGHASALLNDSYVWERSGELRATAANDVQQVLLRVPGVDPSVATTAPPTTAPPDEKDEGEEGGGKGNGKKGGGGDGGGDD